MPVFCASFLSGVRNVLPDVSYGKQKRRSPGDDLQQFLCCAAPASPGGSGRPSGFQGVTKIGVRHRIKRTFDATKGVCEKMTNGKDGSKALHAGGGDR